MKCRADGQGGQVGRVKVMDPSSVRVHPLCAESGLPLYLVLHLSGIG